jgi:hypothetical protein
MRQMREHGTPGHKALSRRRWRHDRPFSSRPDRAEAGVIGTGGENASARAAPTAADRNAGSQRATPKIESNLLGANQACCRFSSTVAPPQQPNHFAPAIPSMQARTGEEKEGAMRVRVSTDGRLLGLDIGDWWTLIAGSMLAGLLAFFL